MTRGAPLLEALRHGTAAHARGAFTLDAARAREKLREFRLADPHRYVLLLVQAMAARGASRIEVRIDADDMEMRSDAEPFSHDELCNLHVLVFSDAPPPAGLRELAMATDAAMAIDPRWVRVTCGDGSEATRLAQHNDGPDRVERVPDGRRGIHVHLRERFGLGVVRRFFRVGGDEAGRGRALLQMRCGFSQIPVVVNGAAIERRRADAAIQHWQPVSLDGVEIGEVGLSPGGGGAGHLELVRHQVWIARHAFDDPAWVGLRGTVDVSSLRTDASLADVVRDDEYERVIEAVEGARDRALAQWITAESAGASPPLGPLVGAVCRRIAMLRVDGRARADAPPLSTLLDAALWRTTIGARRTTAELLAAPEVRCSAFRLRSPPDGLADVILVDDTTRARLALVVGSRLEDVTARFQAAAARERNREALGARPHAPNLPRFYRYEEQHRSDGAIVTCDVGWAPDGGPSWVRLVRDHRLLVELPLAAAPHTTNAVVSAAFTMNDDFDDVVRDDVFLAAVHAVLVVVDRQARAICARVANGGLRADMREELLRYYVATAEDRHLPAALASFGIHDGDSLAAARDMGEPWALGRDVAGHPLWTLPIFTSASGHSVTLRQVATTIEEHGFVRVVTTQERLVDDAPVLAVRVDDLRRRLVLALFGADAVRDADAEFRRWRATKRWALHGTRRPLALGVPCVLGPLPFQHPDGAGVVGIVRTGALATPHARVDVLVESRSLTTVEILSSLRGLVMAIEIGSEWLNEDCDGLAAGGMAVVERAMQVAIETALDAFAARSTATDAADLGVLVEMVAIALPSPSFVQQWIALGDGRTADARAAAYLQLLALGAPEVQGNAAHRHAAVRCLGRLLEVQILSTPAGRGLSLRDVFDAIEQRGRFDYVRWIDAPPPRELAEVALLGAEQRVALWRLVGASALRDRTQEPAPKVRPAEASASAPTLSPTALLRARILAEVRALLQASGSVFTEANLAHVVVEPKDGRHVVARHDARIVVDVRHPLVARVLRDGAEPLIVGVLASSVLTALAAAFVEVSDAGALGLLGLHAHRLRAAGRVRG